MTNTHVPHPVMPTLTPLQEEILVLVANGMTNRAIADRLGLTPGLIGMQIGRLTRILDVASRADLAALGQGDIALP